MALEADGPSAEGDFDSIVAGLDMTDVLDPAVDVELLRVDFSTAMADSKTYNETIERLDRVNTDLDFGILGDVPSEVQAAAEAHMQYSEEIMREYLGDNPAEAIQRMNFLGFMKLSKRIASEADARKLRFEAVQFTNISHRFFVDARKRTIKKLGNLNESLEDAEAVAAHEAFLEGRDAELLSDPSRFSFDPRALLKAVKVFNGATKSTLPSETDFQILRELTSYGGAVLIAQMAAYIHSRPKRLQVVYKLFKSMMDPQVVQEIFNQGEWDIYLNSRKAPQNLVLAVRQYKETFKDIARAEQATGTVSDRVHNTFQALQATAEAGLTRTVEAAVTHFEQLEASGEDVQDRVQVVTLLERRARKVPDEETRTALQSRIQRLADAA